MDTLQVPSEEQPILLKAGRQTTGGYPKIGVVISTDVYLAAQLAREDPVKFSTTTLGEGTVMTQRRSELDKAILHTAKHMLRPAAGDKAEEALATWRRTSAQKSSPFNWARSHQSDFGLCYDPADFHS